MGIVSSIITLSAVKYSGVMVPGTTTALSTYWIVVTDTFIRLTYSLSTSSPGLGISCSPDIVMSGLIII